MKRRIVLIALSLGCLAAAGALDWPGLDKATWRTITPHELEEWLSAEGNGPDDLDRMGYTALHHLAEEYRQEAELYRILIRAGADAGIAGEYAPSVMDIAAGTVRSAEILTLLLENGADANGNGMMYELPIWWAVMDNTPESVRLLLSRGADPEYADHQGRNLATIAAWHNEDPGVLEIFLDRGIPLQNEDEFPLALAAAWNPSEDVLDLLLENGCALDDLAETAVPDDPSLFHLPPGVDSPYRIVASNPNLEIVKRVFRHFPDADIEYDRETEITALGTAAMYNNNPEVIRFLLEKGADPRHVTSDGFTVLSLMMTTAGQRDFSIELIGLFLDLGVDIDARTDSGLTALMIAASDATGPEIIDALLDAGADPSLEDERGLKAIHHFRNNPYRPSGPEADRIEARLEP